MDLMEEVLLEAQVTGIELARLEDEGSGEVSWESIHGEEE